MSETTLTKLIATCREWATSDWQASKSMPTPIVSRKEVLALCDAAARAETLEAEVAKWNKCDSLVCPYEQRALQAEAQLTEVTRERDRYRNALSALPADPSAPACTGNADTCPVDECIVCGERDCPHHDPLHYHHDGCPACTPPTPR